MNNIDIKEILETLVAKYYDFIPSAEKIPIKVFISDCLSETHLELRPDLKETLINDGIKNVDNFNGMMVLPYEIGAPVNIILNKEKMVEYTEDGSMTWLGTFAHELTHAIDFYQMAVMEQLDNYDILLKTDTYLMFHLWSEYHARKIGYGFLRKELGADTDNRTEYDRIEYIKNTEWPTHLNRHFTEYHETTDGSKQMNSTMQLLGRYSVWCDLFPMHFNAISFGNIFENTPWMGTLFNFLNTKNSLDEVYYHFEDMKRIMKTNWSSL